MRRDLVGDGGGVLVGEVAVARPGDDERGVALVQPDQGAREHVVPRAEDEHAVAAALGEREQLEHEVDARDARRQRVTQDARRPDDRLAVGGDELGRADDALELAVPAHRDELRRVDGRVLGEVARRDHAVDPVDHLAHVEPVDRAPEDAGAVDRGDMGGDGDGARSGEAGRRSIVGGADITSPFAPGRTPPS